MQKLLGYARRAVTDYGMIEDGDKIAVGVSGGKDSVSMLAVMARLRDIIGKDYSIVALTLDLGFSGKEGDYGAIRELCDSLGVEYVIKRTQIGEIVFDVRKETNPCSLCARMRRGALHDAAKEFGCNKVALGHNYDDAIETFMLNLFNEGRIGCFSPVTYLSRKEITVIRPLIYAPESDIRKAVKDAGLPVVESACPANRETAREDMKNYLRQLEKEHKGIKNRIFGAMKRGNVSGWGNGEGEE